MLRYNIFCAHVEVFGFIKLMLIIADFDCMLFLAAATHSLITELS